MMCRTEVELRHLRYVIAASEHGSFRRAALAMKVQESAVSRRIRDLEDEIGSALFNRHSSGVTLTYAGEQFVRRVRLAIGQIYRAKQDVRAIGRVENGLVSIGILSSMASGFIADLVDAYGADHPDVRLDFIEGGPMDHIPAVRRHHLDIAFLTGAPDAEECETAHLWNERIYVAIPTNDELMERETIDWTDLRDRDFIVSEAPPGPQVHDYIVKHLGELGYSPSIRQQAVYRDTLMQIVAKGQGVTLTNEATIATQFAGIAYRPLANEILPFRAIWSPTNDNPAFRRFLSMARQMSRRRLKRVAPSQIPDPSQ